MGIRPAHNYPTTYRGSAVEIEILDADGEWYGCGERTGLAIDLDDAPVYRIKTFRRDPDLSGRLVALTANGFVWR